MLKVPTLTTPRLRLEPLRRPHSPGMFALWSAPEVCKYSGPVEDWEGNLVRLPAPDSTESDKIIQFFEKHEAQGTAFRWAILHRQGEFVGTLGCNSLGDPIEIAYHLIPRHWGQGFMGEACQ